MLKTVIFTIVLVASEAGVDYRRLYEETMRKFHKTPPLASSTSSQDEHFLAFKQHVTEVLTQNDQADKEWVAEINQFTLETDEELKRHLGVNMSELVRGQVKVSLQQHPPMLMSTSDLPEEVDYTEKMTEVKDQGGCGSCWAFGAVASLEYQVNKDRTGSLKNLSEQQYTDCVYPNRDGCAGGWPSECYTWSSEHENHIASTKAYSYTGISNGKCMYGTKKTALSGWTIAPDAVYVQGDANLQAAVANRDIGVLTVAIAVTSSFYYYKEGVYSSKQCGPQRASINHAVNVIGYGVDKTTGVAYWRVRNSWGSSWGDGGYINMKRGVNGKNLNMCQISDWAHYPTVSGEDDGENEDQEEEEEEDEGDEEKSMEWCEFKDKELEGYTSGERVGFSDFGLAKSTCGASADCHGLTMESDEYTLRSGSELVDSVGSTSFIPEECPGPHVCTWEKVADKKFKGTLTKTNLSMDKAKAACQERAGCVGITCKSAKKCALVRSQKSKNSRKFDSYKMTCPQ
ncbi:hypothetical protein ACHWQZ_G006317 [Mnemiopsis leidyi]